MSRDTSYGPPQIRRRRKVRGPITLVVLIAFMGGAGWYGWENVLNVPVPVERFVCETPTPGAKQQISAAEVTVNVYNAGEIDGLAEDTADALSERGFGIGAVANDPKKTKVKKVIVRGRAAEAPEVVLLAAQVAGEPAPEADNRQNSTVDLVVGEGFTGLQAKAPSSMSIETDVPSCETKTFTPAP